MDQIVCGECVEKMKELPENHVDLTVTSPPYDDLRTYEGYHFDYQSVAKELYRITKPGGVVVWVVGDQTENGSETCTSFKQAIYFKEEVGFNLHDTMIYQRNSVSFPDKIRYYNCFQYMFVFSKGTPKTINLIKDHKNLTHGKKATAKWQREKDGSFKEAWSYRNKKSRPEYSVRWNLWRYDVGSLVMADDRLWVGHPGVFPVKLAEDHIRTWTNKEDLVFDPMVGSGQTVIAAKRLGRHYLGMDVSANYCALTNERLDLYYFNDMN